MKYCKKCGTQFEAEDLFCGYCGLPLHESMETNISDGFHWGNIINGEFPFYIDLEKHFPTDSDKYGFSRKMIYTYSLFLIISLFCFVFIKKFEGTFLFSPVLYLSKFINLFLRIMPFVALYWSLYFFTKYKIWKYYFNLFVGIIVSLFISNILAAISGGLLLIPCIILAIYANRRRIELLKRYMSYVLHLVIIPIIGFVLVLIPMGVIAGASLFANQHSSIVVLNLLIDLWAGIGQFLLLLLFTFLIIHLMKKEEKRGTPFEKFIILTNAIPVTCVFLTISYLTLSHINHFSEDSVFGTDGDPFSSIGLDGFDDMNAAYASPSDASIDTAGLSHIDDRGISSEAPIDTADLSSAHDISFTDDASSVNTMESFNMQSKVFTNASSSEFATEVPHEDISNSHDVGINVFSSTSENIDSSAGDGTPDISNVEVAPSQTTIQDSNGFTQATVNHLTPTHDVINDNMGHHIGDGYINPLTGDKIININGNSFRITAGGSVLDSQNIQIGKSVSDGLGGHILKDLQEHTLAKINAEGKIMDEFGFSIGKIK